MLLGVIRDGEFLTAAQVKRRPRNPLRADYPTPGLSPDYPAYASPLGTGMIEGRRARREDMARGHCRPQERGEGLGGVYHNERFAAKHGKPWTPPPAPAKPADDAPFVRSAPTRERLKRHG